MNEFQAMAAAMEIQGSKAGFNARGPLEDVLGAKGVQLDLGALPLIGTGVNLAENDHEVIKVWVAFKQCLKLDLQLLKEKSTS